MSELGVERIVTLDIEDARGCLRTYLIDAVNRELNAGATREAEDATDALQSPDVLRDTTESPYLTAPVVFDQPDATCGSCGQEVNVSRSGIVSTEEGCAISGFCEWQIAKRLGASGYQPLDESVNEKPVDCAGYGCTAKVALWRTVLGKNMTPEIVHGRCAVDVLGTGWLTRCGLAITQEKLDAPVEGRMQTYDGI